MNEYFSLNEREIHIIDRSLLAFAKDLKEYDGKFGSPDLKWEEVYALHQKVRNLIVNVNLKKDVSTKVIQ